MAGIWPPCWGFRRTRSALTGDTLQAAGARVVTVLDADRQFAFLYRHHMLAVAAGRVQPGEFVSYSLRRTEPQ